MSGASRELAHPLANSGEELLAWFNNRYVCPECRAVWDDSWSCGCDDECAECGTRDISPVSSEDVTVIMRPASDGSWTILQSAADADDGPYYVDVGRLKPSKLGEFHFAARANVT